MTPATLRADLRAAGLAVALSGDVCGEYTLLVSPRRLVRDEHRAAIALCREGLIELLYAEYADGVFPPVDTGGRAVRWACSAWPGDVPEALPMALPMAAQREELASL